jgi:hypothetical protein
MGMTVGLAAGGAGGWPRCDRVDVEYLHPY